MRVYESMVDFLSEEKVMARNTVYCLQALGESACHRRKIFHSPFLRIYDRCKNFLSERSH